MHKDKYLDWCHKISSLTLLNDFCNLNNLKDLTLSLLNYIDFDISFKGEFIGNHITSFEVL